MENSQNLPSTVNEAQVITPDQVVEQPDQTVQQVVINCVSTNTRSDKIALINALESADGMINNMVGQIIELKGVYAETHFSRKQQKPVCRVLLLSVDGKSYATGSFVFMNSLKNIIDIMGAPTVADPLKIQIEERPMEKGNALIAKVIE